MHGNVITGDVFTLRSNELNLSWRAYTGILRRQGEIEAYQAFHEFDYTIKKIGRKRYRPGLIRFRWFELVREGLWPEWKPEPKQRLGRDNPYWQLHYETSSEPSTAVRIRLAEIATNRVLARCIAV